MKTICVVGGGTAGWMAAGYFAVKGYDVTIIESPEIGIVGVGESTVPAINWLANEMGMEEHEWMPLANATFKLGIKHEDWRLKDSTWWHWFLYDRTKDESQFEYVRTGTKPSREKLEYGYHVDAYTFGQTICKVAAMKHKCTHVVGHVTEVIGDPVNGIQEVILTDGKKFSADFYIDCTGWKKLLANKVEMRYRPYVHLLNNRAVASPQPSLAVTNQYTTTKARTAGWMWEIPLQSRRGCGYVYSNKHITDEEAVEEFCKEYPDTDRSNINFLQFTPEVSEESIKCNVATTGLAAGFIEPLEATSIFLSFFLIRQAYFFVSGQRDKKVLNRNVERVFDETALYVLCHYTLSGKEDNEYWKYYKEAEKTLNTRQHVLDKASKPDLLEWKEHTLFQTYSWWSIANHFGLITK